MNFERAEKYRNNSNPPWLSKTGDRFGFFKVIRNDTMLRVLVDDGLDTGWEHVSVSTTKKTPRWDDMRYVKSLFWDDDETVVQFHPKKSEYVNYHAYCLHLWKKKDSDFELPPSILVGPQL